MLKNSKRIIFAVGFTYLLLLSFLFLFQRNILYRPSSNLNTQSSYGNNQENLSQVLPGFTVENLTTSDDVKILAWYKKSANNKVVLYFHGNAGNLFKRTSKFKSFSENKYGVLAVSYRGYLGSGGSPSEVGLLKDADAALQFLFDEGYKPNDIILFGTSLGSGVSVQLATKFKPFAVILESPFSSIVDVAKETYWYAPIDLILKDKFESVKYAPQITSPVLIIHATGDKVVPYKFGKKLFDAINAPKKLVTVEADLHSRFEDKFVIAEMKKFFTEMRLNKMRENKKLSSKK